MCGAAHDHDAGQRDDPHCETPRPGSKPARIRDHSHLQGMSSMTRHATAGSILVLILSFAASAAETPAPVTARVLRAERYVDVEAGRVVAPAVVVVKGNRIEAI